MLRGMFRGNEGNALHGLFWDTHASKKPEMRAKGKRETGKGMLALGCQKLLWGLT